MLPVTQGAIDSLSRGFAIALGSPIIRAQLRDDLRDSPFPSHTLEVASYLRGTSGKALTIGIARALNMSPQGFLLFVAHFPTLLIEMERPIDRVRWTGTSDVVVYGLAIAGVARVKAGPVAIGFGVHGDTVSVPLWTAAGFLEYPSDYRGRPRIWVSFDKHANYRNKSVCNGEWNDVCDTFDTGTTYDDLDVRTDANLGNSFNVVPATSSTRLIDCAVSRHPGTGRAGYGTECFWDDSTQFMGWNVNTGQEGSTAYRTMLSYYQF